MSEVNQVPALTTEQKLASIPTPSAMLGENLKAAIESNLTALQNVGPVETEVGRLTAEGLLSGAKAIRKRVGERRLDITRILDETKTAYTSAEKEAVGELEKQIATLEASIKTYLKAEDEKNRLKEEQIRLQAEKDAARKRIPESKAAVAVAAEEAVAQVRESGPIGGVAKKWVFDITDPAAVPEAYKTVNEAAIRKAINEGARAIPGVVIRQELTRSGRV